MQTCDIFTGLGEQSLPELLRCVSLGKLKTYQLFDRVKTRLHLGKLNQENLRKASPRLWARLQEGDQELASDLSQAILVSHMELIVAVLDLLEIPHNEGFFDKDAKVAEQLKDGWQQKAYDAFSHKFPPALLVFYLNHLGCEVAEAMQLFRPAGSAK
ncbi:MAG: hypothetical protein FJW20_22860 [Acidimicrobiia bacterium]|nr:hypothetical protein [Acidimicrobiia bacterium]